MLSLEGQNIKKTLFQVPQVWSFSIHGSCLAHLHFLMMLPATVILYWFLIKFGRSSFMLVVWLTSIFIVLRTVSVY